VGNMTYTLNTIPETKSHKSFWYSNLPSDIGNVCMVFIQNILVFLCSCEEIKYFNYILSTFSSYNK
jgi:hypothetical protein